MGLDVGKWSQRLYQHLGPFLDRPPQLTNGIITKDVLENIQIFYVKKVTKFGDWTASIVRFQGTCTVKCVYHRKK